MAAQWTMCRTLGGARPVGVEQVSLTKVRLGCSARSVPAEGVAVEVVEATISLSSTSRRAIVVPMKLGAAGDEDALRPRGHPSPNSRTAGFGSRFATYPRLE